MVSYWNSGLPGKRTSHCAVESGAGNRNFVCFFVIRTTLLKYRLQLPGFELSQAVRLAQRQFDDESAKIQDGMANRLEGKPPRGDDKFEHSFEQLQQTVRSCCSEGPQESLAPNLPTFLALSRDTASLTMSLSKEV